MTGRFAASAEQDVDLPTSAGDEEPIKPARPGLVELAAAILIVGGALGVIAALANNAPQPAGLEAVPLLTLVLNLAQVGVGLAIRWGWLWLVALNYVAVLAFLDLLAAGESPVALMLGAAEVLVVVILIAKRPWFQALAAWRAEVRARAVGVR